MYAQDDGKINYEYNGKKHTIHLKKSETAHVGTFPLEITSLKLKSKLVIKHSRKFNDINDTRSLNR